MIDKNEVKKDLYKSKVMALFSHYVSGNLYYSVEYNGDLYQFPIPTVELTLYGSMENGDLCILSSDLGSTSFFREMKGSELNRWISKAIDSEEFIKIGI